jgi:hypothetical protein
LGVKKSPIRLYFPDLAAGAVTVPQFDFGSVGEPVPVDVEAAAKGLQGSVGVVRPALVESAGLAAPEIDDGTIAAAVIADYVDALATGSRDREGGR